eukprot:c21576_g1_i1.p1 GENE.c21576_g1_i1~~c21576_g1_i1.p1  ORF type:complete len:125 (+),score=61.60 c21576_g1_i1:46-420(+)
MAEGVEVVTIRAGDGVNFPRKGQLLTMHYEGRLASNNKVFDSSYEKNKPFQFVIGWGQVIRGWDEGVMKMSQGEKATLKIRSDYGYGAGGVDGVIPPNSDLIFDVELIKCGEGGKKKKGGCLIQ